MPVRRNVKKSVKSDVKKFVSFRSAVSDFFRKYFVFNGTATRTEFWWTLLFICLGTICMIVLAFVLAMIVAAVVQPGDALETSAGVYMLVSAPVLLFMFAIVVPMYALLARRLHDIGVSAKILWVGIVVSVISALFPRFGNYALVRVFSICWTIFLYILCLFPSKERDNPYRV